MSDKLERNTRTVMMLTATSRIAGLIRDATASRLLGTSDAMGAFWIAFLIPNLFRRLFGEGALSSAFLPTYQRLVDDNPLTASAVAGCLLGGLIVVLSAIVVLGEAVLFLVSSSLDHTSPAIWLTMVMLPYIATGVPCRHHWRDAARARSIRTNRRSAAHSQCVPHRSSRLWMGLVWNRDPREPSSCRLDHGGKRDHRWVSATDLVAHRPPREGAP